MASAKKSASSARSSSAKSAKKAAVKRGAAAKKAPAKKTPPKKAPARKTPAKKTAAKATRTAARKTATSHTMMPGNPSNWLPGKLVVKGDQIGVKTREGFVSLETLAANNEKLELVFGLNSGRSGGDASAPLQRLIEFIRSHSDDRVGIVVRCCVF